jgi:hypothetical protein
MGKLVDSEWVRLAGKGDKTLRFGRVVVIQLII